MADLCIQNAVVGQTQVLWSHTNCTIVACVDKAGRKEIHRRGAEEASDELVCGVCYATPSGCRSVRPARDEERRSRRPVSSLRPGLAQRRSSMCRVAGAGWRYLVLMRNAASRSESGSSNRQCFGSRTMARPMATRWRRPPEILDGLRSMRGSRLSILDALSARSLMTDFGRLPFLSAMHMVPRKFKCWKSA